MQVEQNEAHMSQKLDAEYCFTSHAVLSLGQETAESNFLCVRRGVEEREIER